MCIRLVPTIVNFGVLRNINNTGNNISFLTVMPLISILLTMAGDTQERIIQKNIPRLFICILSSLSKAKGRKYLC